MSRKRKYTPTKTFFGERTIVFVKFPFSWTGHAVVNQMFWAKTYDVVALYDGFIIKCYVKPWYLKHFIKDNRDYIQWHQHSVNSEGEDYWVLDGTIYD